MTFQLVGNAAEIYEKVMVPHWFGRWAEALVDSLDLQENQNVLDVACGTGVTTRLAKAGVGPGGRVDGLDINQSMLAKAQEIAANHDIGWIKADVGETGLPSGSYDVIMSQHGYHYFPTSRELWQSSEDCLLRVDEWPSPSGMATVPIPLRCVMQSNVISRLTLPTSNVPKGKHPHPAS